MSLPHSPCHPSFVSASASRACARGLAAAFAAGVVVLAAGADAKAGALGGGLIELLFTGKAQPMRQASLRLTVDPEILRYAEDPRYQRQVVDYHGPEKPGTIIISTKQRRLYYVMGGGKASATPLPSARKAIPLVWSGTSTVSSKPRGPDSRYPPADMRQRRPDLPGCRAGGPNNPLGARALYLGDTLYRIHGTNEPWYMGTAAVLRLHPHDTMTT